MEKLPLELPDLRLALVGFSPAEQTVLEMALSKVRAGLRWKQSAVADADAMFASGPRAVALSSGLIQIGAGMPGVKPVLLDMQDSNRPLAFSLPFSVPGVALGPTFDVRKAESIRALLLQFTGWLRPMAVNYWLGSRIVHERLDLSETVYHVSIDGRLQAVVSRRNGVGVLPIADPARLADAVWARRPGPADEIPAHFVQTPLTEVLWRYAMRSPRNLLPSYFRSGPIYWCRSPLLPQRLFRDSHLMIVRELAHCPTSFSELGRRTGLADAVLARDLAALRFAGAVSHDRKQALHSTVRHGGKAAHPAQQDKTAPAPLTPQGA